MNARLVNRFGLGDHGPACEGEHTLEIRPLTCDDLGAFLDQLAATRLTSGRHGDAFFGPYSPDEPIVRADVRRHLERDWVIDLNTPGWRRAWGVFDGEIIAGSGTVTAGGLPSSLHRVSLGMGFRRAYRRQGLGTRLLSEIIRWCRQQPSVAWIDLGVIADNLPAQALYQKLGFEQTGVLTDQWRIDGQCVDEIAMTLAVD